MLLLGGCPPPPKNELVNTTDEDIRVELASGSIFARKVTIKPGERFMNLSPEARYERIWIGECLHQYPDLSWERLIGLVREAGLEHHAPDYYRKSYEFRVLPDRSISVFPVAEDGTALAELTAPGIPARPQVDCRTKG
jgi:hypothetical protein